MVQGLIVIMNPPWRAQQRSANDFLQNVKHPEIEQRVKDTYKKRSKARMISALNDYYVSAMRWASDRVKEGAIGMVTNSGFLDSRSMNGVRKCLVDEFSYVNVLDLKGESRGTGDFVKKQGGNVFGVRVGVAITILLKSRFKPPPTDSITLGEIPDYKTVDEKLKLVIDETQETKFRVAWSGC